MQLVGHVMEELARFNPLARVVPELIIGGFSPATEMRVSTLDKSLEDKVEELDELTNRLEEENGRLMSALEEIKDICDDDELPPFSKLDKISSIVTSELK